MKKSEKNLKKLASDIKREAESALQLARSCLAHARKAGELLIQAKDAVGHGNWEGWPETNCGFSTRTAQVYMKIAGGWDVLQSKTQDAADLTISEASQLLGKQSGEPGEFGDVIKEKKPPAIEVTPDGRVEVLPMPDATTQPPSWVADSSPCPADEFLSQVALMEEAFADFGPEAIALWTGTIRKEAARRLEGLQTEIGKKLLLLRVETGVRRAS